MQIKPSDLLDAVNACHEVHNISYRHSELGFEFSEETKRKARLAVYETYNLYLLQIVEERARMEGKK